jgi:type II secretory pathway pseudopilin PulG
MTSRYRRGFSVLEGVLVLALLAAVSILVLPQLGTQAESSDQQARVALSAFLLAEDSIYATTGSFSDVPSDLTALAPSVTFVTGETPSDSPQTLSVAVDQTSAAAAAMSSSGSCWYLRTSFDAPAGTEPVLWAVDDTPDGCSGSDALVFTPDPGVGSSPSNVYVVP